MKVPRTMGIAESFMSCTVGITLAHLGVEDAACPVLGVEEDLAEAEDAHDHGNDPEAVQQLHLSEGEARRPHHRVDPYHGDHQIRRSPT